MKTEQKNGLSWKELHSELVPLESGGPNTFSSLLPGSLPRILQDKFPKSAFFVAWLEHALLVGRWKDARIQSYTPFDLEEEEQYIQQLRVFDRSQELLVRRTAEGLKGRLRQDDETGKGTDVVVAHQVLFGTRKGTEGNQVFTEIVENRGTSLILPFSGLAFDKEDWLIRRVCIKTHNYITYREDTGQAGYEDARFVCFTDGEDELSDERRDG